MGTEVVHAEFLWGNMRKRDRLEDRGVEGRAILKWIFKMFEGGMNWIDQAQDSERWRALVNPLRMKVYLSDLKIQFVPRSKHFSSRL